MVSNYARLDENISKDDTDMAQTQNHDRWTEMDGQGDYNMASTEFVCHGPGKDLAAFGVSLSLCIYCDKTELNQRTECQVYAPMQTKFLSTRDANS